MTAANLIKQDADLIEQVSKGNVSACRTLASRHLDGTYRLAYRILGDPMQAEDVAQEAFLRLWKISAHWKAQAQIKTWLHRVTHNLCIDRLRKENRYSDAEVPDLEDPADSPLRQQEKRQIKRQIEEALQDLPARQRIAITLVHFEEYGNREAADMMEISVDALESLLARGRRKLKSILSPLKDVVGGN